MNDILYLLFLPLYSFGIIMTTAYASDTAFRYEFKNKKAGYITMCAIAVFTGILTDIAYVLSPGDLYSGEDVSVNYSDLVSTAGTMISFIVMMVMVRGKVWKRVLGVFLSSEMIGCFNHIFQALFIYVTRIRSWENDDYVLFGSIAAEMISTGLVFLFLFFISKVRSKNDNTPLPLPLMGIFTVILLLVNSFVQDDAMSSATSDDVAKPVLMLLILATVLMFFYLRVTRKERDGLKKLNKINEELVNSQTKYFEASAKADSEIRAMRHDMRNNIQVLMLLLEQGDYDKMRSYLEEMGDNLTSVDISAHTGDTIADTIIADKSAKAESLGLTLECSGKIAGIEISPVDMCKMLANLLDNAIEASSVPELSEIDNSNKVINLQFKKTDNFFMISVVNPCSKAPEIVDGKILTSKKDTKNHGFGIHNIETAAAVYGGELTVSCEEKAYGFLFRSEIIFPI